MRAKLEAAGLADRVEVDSCGTTGWHAGEPPTRQAVAVARSRGYDLSGLAPALRQIADHGLPG